MACLCSPACTSVAESVESCPAGPHMNLSVIPRFALGWRFQTPNSSTSIGAMIRQDSCYPRAIHMTRALLQPIPHRTYLWSPRFALGLPFPYLQQLMKCWFYDSVDRASLPGLSAVRFANRDNCHSTSRFVSSLAMSWGGTPGGHIHLTRAPLCRSHIEPICGPHDSLWVCRFHISNSL